MLDLLQLEFMQNAVLSGLIAALICGIMGSLIVVKRMVFLAGGVAHASYGGVGISLFFSLPLLPSTLSFSLAVALLIAFITHKQKHRVDAATGAIWAAGMAVGIILSDLTPGYRGEWSGYLFGSILAVSREDLWFMVGILAVILAWTSLNYRELLALAYDEEFAQVRGIPVKRLYALLLCLIAVSVVSVIRLVGLILILALLTIAPLMVENYASSLSKMMIYSSILNVVFILVGLFLSYRFNISSGSSIIAVAVCCYALSFLLSGFLIRPLKQ